MTDNFLSSSVVFILLNYGESQNIIISIIAEIPNTKHVGIQRGDNTHHQLHAITFVSLSVMKTIVSNWQKLMPLYILVLLLIAWFPYQLFLTKLGRYSNLGPAI